MSTTPQQEISSDVVASSRQSQPMHFDDVDLDADTSAAETNAASARTSAATVTASPDDTKTTNTASNSRSRYSMLKNVFLLGGMWAVGWGAAMVQIPSAQNVMTSLHRDSISTVPLGLIMLLSAPCAVLVPKLIGRVGEKRAFALAAAAGIAGSVLQAAGVWWFGPPNADADADGGNAAMEIALLCVGAAIQAFPFASTNNLRFAVAYFSTAEFLPKATALVVLGGAAGALLGPMLSNLTRDLVPGAAYAGNFLQAAALWLAFGVLAVLVDFAPPPAAASAAGAVSSEKEICDGGGDDDEMVSAEEGIATVVSVRSANTTSSSSSSMPPRSSVVPEERSLREILAGTSLALLILSQCLSYNIMGLYMTNIQLAMGEHGYTATECTNAITYHMLGMYLPSLFSGHLIGALGTWPSSLAGFAVLLLGGGLFYVNDSLLMFNLGIVVVGVGWNLSFVGPSAAVSSSVIRTESEKPKVQGLNDGVMLFTIGVFNLASSAIYDAIGSWDAFNAVMMGFSVLSMLIASAKAVRDRVVAFSKQRGQC